MINRAIVIFPDFENSQVIDKIREKYDPLHNYIPPHITLIFPFQSNITDNELLEHVGKQLSDLKSFELSARGIISASDGYVFLNVVLGNDKVIDLHNKLYGGILESYHNREIPYIPHITVARLANEEMHRKVIDELSDFNVEFKVVIDNISIELLDETEKSVTENKYKL